MNELKACPLLCNLEQLNDRINNLSAGLATMSGKHTIRVNRIFLTEVLSYMEELLGMRREEENRHAAPENKPLTMEELRRMDGEPVFAIPLNKNADWIEHWAILRKDIVTANSISTKGRMYFLYLKDYGKTWLAYARKPEGSETNGSTI